MLKLIAFHFIRCSLALRKTEIDYTSDFSLDLDIEGSEWDILKTIPFDKITFKVNSIYIFYICCNFVIPNIIFRFIADAVRGVYTYSIPY